MIKLAGASAIGAVGAALAMGEPASAANGDNLVVGQTTTATSPTALTNASVVAPSDGVLEVELTSDISTGTALSASAGSSGTGVKGTGTYGVYGYQPIGVSPGQYGGYGVFGQAANYGVGADGGVAPLILFPAGSVGAPSGNHQLGELFVDHDGSLFFCVAGDLSTSGTWVRLAGVGTAGQLTVVPSPVRVYDSRPPGTEPAAVPGAGDGALLGGNTRPVSLQTGAVGNTATPAVPSGASAALLTLTIVDTTGSGFLTLYPNGGTQPSTSSTNWVANGAVVATTTVSGLDALARVAVHAGGSGGTDFIIDVIGYYA